MRLHFLLTPNKTVVPFDYQHFLVGTFHKWMGWNEMHDEISLYSLSWLQGGKAIKDGLEFPNGARWFVGFWDEDIGKQLIMKAMKDPEVCCGMFVKEIQMQDDPTFSGKERFIVSSPVLIRKYDDKRKAIHLTFKDEDAETYLTETLKKKLNKASITANIKVSFDKNYYNPKTKLVRINNINNRANFCPVIVEGDAEAVKFAWNVGIGHSTGCGFGALY